MKYRNRVTFTFQIRKHRVQTYPIKKLKTPEIVDKIKTYISSQKLSERSVNFHKLKWGIFKISYNYRIV